MSTNRTTSIPRLEMTQLRADLAEALKPRVQRLGYLGEFFKCAAHDPESLLAFIRFTDALKHALPDNLTELVALTVAAVTGNRYERHQHERLSDKLGFSRDWITAVIELRPDAPSPLNESERAIQRLAIALLKHHGNGAKRELAAASDAIGAAGAVSVMMLVGRYETHAMFVNALELEPPVPSIFENSK